MYVRERGGGREKENSESRKDVNVVCRRWSISKKRREVEATATLKEKSGAHSALVLSLSASLFTRELRIALAADCERQKAAEEKRRERESEGEKWERREKFVARHRHQRPPATPRPLSLSLSLSPLARTTSLSESPLSDNDAPAWLDTRRKRSDERKRDEKGRETQKEKKTERESKVRVSLYRFCTRLFFHLFHSHPSLSLSSLFLSLSPSLFPPQSSPPSSLKWAPHLRAVPS